ncbi:MAG TPA: hypothetical protein PKD27_09570, partial [Tepidiformaceae bacterium]|nr:hypothetical protein [Tepidiformaceae bacterium]
MMGKEKFTRDKPHVNTPGVGDRQVSDGTSTSGASDDMPAESISFNYSKLETGAHHVEPDHADQLAAPPLASTGG